MTTKTIKAAPKKAATKQAAPAKPTTLDFGDVVKLLKAGAVARRAGWPGKHQFIYLNMGSHAGLAKTPAGEFVHAVPSDLFELGAKGTVTRMPNLSHRTTGGATVHGWTPSQVDLLASDWVVVQ